MLRKFFKWIFKSELTELEIELVRYRKNNLDLDYTLTQSKNKLNEISNMYSDFEKIFGKIDLSIDHHKYSPSWAVFSLQGEKSNYVKFVNLGDKDVREIAQIVSRYERVNNVKYDECYFGAKQSFFHILNSDRNEYN